MDPTRLAPEPANGNKRQQAIQDAHDMFRHAVRTCEKLKIPVPPYDFLELIGKGGSGRVYKCREQKTGNLVAIKILDTDNIDFFAHFSDKDNTIRDFQKEITILQKLKESHARNINVIHDTMEVGAQLWFVSDYCTGGSVRTLMRALPPGQPGLEEHYIIPIARELLVALAALHSLDIIHRDIKCTNVYITETGNLQLGDYGVSAITDEETNKRTTILGTPHWMPREMLAPTSGNETLAGYGSEVDIWAFGCTVFEMATSSPPNAQLPPKRLDRALLKAPRLEGGQHSQQLRDFIAFCLNNDPQQRPTAEAALEHPYIANTERKYPTSALVKLIEKYKLWEYGGGIRQSLFLQGGAPSIPSAGKQDAVAEADGDDWNFSTSEHFNSDFERRYSHVIGLSPQDFDFQLDASDESATARPPPLDTAGPSRMAMLEATWLEQSVIRGGESLARLYRKSAAEYKLHTPIADADKKATEDLPLRNLTQDSEVEESFVDMDEAGYDPSAPFNFDFLDATTLKARKSRRMSGQDEGDDEDTYVRFDSDIEKRATMEWTFPSISKKTSPKRATMDWTFASARAAEPDEPEMRMDPPPAGDGKPPPSFRPTLKHTQTMPLGGAGDYIHPVRSLRAAPATSPTRHSVASLIDLDMGMVEMGMADDAELERPGTATSTTGSQFSDMTSGDPFDLEDDSNLEEVDRNRFSCHKQWQSEGGQFDRLSRRSIPMHARGSSLSSTDNELDRRSNELTYHVPQTTNGRLLKSASVDVQEDLDSWPNFDQAGIERVSSHEGSISSRDLEVVHVRQQSSAASSSNELWNRATIAFPRITAPHADSLSEEASVQMLGAELDRLCRDFGESMMATAAAFHQHRGLQDDDSVSESESAFENEA